MSIGERTFDMAEIICHMELGLKLMGVCHIQKVQKRHLDLQYILAPSVKELTLIKQEITDFTFGDDMQQAHKDILVKNKVTAIMSTLKKKSSQNFIQSPPGPFLGHGQGSPCMHGWGSPHQNQAHFCPWTGGYGGYQN